MILTQPGPAAYFLIPSNQIDAREAKIHNLPAGDAVRECKNDSLPAGYAPLAEYAASGAKIRTLLAGYEAMLLEKAKMTLCQQDMSWPAM